MSTVDSVLENTVSIIEDNILNKQREIKSCLNNAGIDINTIPGLEILLNEENSKKRVFEDLNTNAKRVAYFKEKFGLKVN